MATPDRARAREITLRRIYQSAARRAQRAHRARSCEGKYRFSTQARAAWVAAKMAAERGEEYNEYKCEHCWAWHVGHVPIWKRKETQDAGGDGGAEGAAEAVGEGRP